MKKSNWRAVFISDIHLGTKMCQEDHLLDFLKSFDADHLFIVGDAIDLWSLNRRYHWSKTQTEILRRILKMSEKSNVTYILGNHDETFRKMIAHNGGMEVFGQIVIKNEVTWNALNGNRILVTHGDQFDYSMKIPDFIFGALDYLLGFIPKNKMERLTTFANQFTSTESMATKFIKNDNDHEIILMGHTHIPKMEGRYWNDGDWVSNCSYITEDHNGHWALNFFK